MKKSVKSVRKQIALWLGVLIIGWIVGYIIATHQQNKRQPYPYHDRMMKSMFERPISKYNDFDDLFDDLDEFDYMFESMREEQDKRMKKIRDNFWEDFDIDPNIENLHLTGEFDSKWSFKYYEKNNINWNKSTYNVQWSWNQWEDTWNIVINWADNDKTFSYSWNFKDWESKWILTDSEWNITETTLSEVLKYN